MVHGWFGLVFLVLSVDFCLLPLFLQEKSKRIFYLLTGVVLLCGIVSAAAGGVVLNFKEAPFGSTAPLVTGFFPRHHLGFSEVIEGYMSPGAVYVVLVAGIAMSLFACMGIYAVRPPGWDWKSAGCGQNVMLAVMLLLSFIDDLEHFGTTSWSNTEFVRKDNGEQMWSCHSIEVTIFKMMCCPCSFWAVSKLRIITKTYKDHFVASTGPNDHFDVFELPRGWRMLIIGGLARPGVVHPAVHRMRTKCRWTSNLMWPRPWRCQNTWYHARAHVGRPKQGAFSERLALSLWVMCWALSNAKKFIRSVKN